MSLSETRRHQMFPVLDPAQIATARRFASGPERSFAPGAVVFEVGERQAPAWLVLAGHVEVVGRDGLDQEVAITTHRAGHITGEISQLTGRASLATGRAGPEGCTALPFDAAHLRALVVGSAEVGEILMRAFILRRVGLIQEGGAGSVLVGRPGTPDLVRLQGFLARNGYPYTVLDASSDEEGRAVVERFGVQPERAAADGLPERHGAEAADRRRGRRLPRHHARSRPASGLRRRGGRRRPRRPRDRGLRRLRGPLGAGARPARLRRPGRRLGADRELPRLPDRHLRHGAGRPRLQPGAEVRRRDRDPARGRAARLRRPGAAPRRPLRLELTDGRAVRARTVVVASGARYRRPDMPNLADFEGAGVSYWASPVEAKLCEGEEVALVGGGNSAGQAAVFLAPKVKRLHLVVRGAGLEATMSRYLIDRIRGAAERRAARRHRDGRRSRATATEGLTAATFRDARPAARTRLRDAPPVPVHRRRPECRLAGRTASRSTPRASCSPASPARDGRSEAGRPALPLETSVPGVFAIGDVRAGSTKRVAAAVGEGAAVVAQIHTVLALQAERG